MCTCHLIEWEVQHVNSAVCVNRSSDGKQHCDEKEKCHIIYIASVFVVCAYGYMQLW